MGASSITKATVEHWSTVEIGEAGASGATRAREALQLLISASITQVEAGAMGIAVSKQEVNDQLLAYSTDHVQGVPFTAAARGVPFVGLLQRTGETSADRLWLMEMNLLAFKVEQKRLHEVEATISGAEIARYYATHRRRFVVPEQRDLEVLGNNSFAVVKHARKEIEAGANFIAVAKRVSTDQEAPEGLQLALQHGQEEPAYEAHVFGAKLGVLSGPYKLTFYYLFRVRKIRPAVQRTMAQSEAMIRRLIVARRRDSLAAKWLREDALRWTAKTSCHPGYVVPSCKQFSRAA